MKKNLLSIIFAMMSAIVMAQAPAFPGAEGHGRYVTGGRGGKIVHVTNLNDHGTGSFREAVKGSAKKIVVFDVGGVIALESDISIGDNTTIAYRIVDCTCCWYHAEIPHHSDGQQ